jgi:hypothetical protein
MVGTSATRSPAARQRLTARRSADTVRTTRIAMGQGSFDWGPGRASYQSRGSEATWRLIRSAPRCDGALHRSPDMATLMSGLPLIKSAYWHGQ